MTWTPLSAPRWASAPTTEDGSWVLIVNDIIRALALGSIPLAQALDVLTIGQLYVVALLVSVLTILFDVAYRSYLPSLVRREELVEGNSKLQASGSVAASSGPGWPSSWASRSRS